MVTWYIQHFFLTMKHDVLRSYSNVIVSDYPGRLCQLVISVTVVSHNVNMRLVFLADVELLTL